MTLHKPQPYASQFASEVSEDAVARAFTELHGETLRYDHDAGRWYEWTGDYWRPDGTGKAFAYCRDVARQLSMDAAASRMQSARKATFAAGVERFARTDPMHAVTQGSWDADPWLLGCPGATIDLRDGCMRRPDPADGITKQTAVAPAVKADCPLWLAFLDEATGGDAAMVRFLQQWCGYSLTGDVREHALVFIYGDGGNGKSVFLSTIAGILGDYATTAGMDTFTASRSDRHPTDLAMLRGARLVSASETEEGRAWAESRIKQLTGGDVISARFMRQDFFAFTPQFKLLIVGNHKPTLHNVDEAARRRINIVPFTRRPAKPDRMLEQKLRAEWPAILRWAIDGCADWQSSGLVRPERVREATAAYFADQDLFGQWLEDECVVEPTNAHRWETSADLFAGWGSYAKAVGEEPGSAKRMGENLTRRGLARMTKKVSGKAHKAWTGISLRRPGDAE